VVSHTLLAKGVSLKALDKGWKKIAQNIVAGKGSLFNGKKPTGMSVKSGRLAQW
jgi:hypothetical protein